ncbi:IclR family transcriptional regulator domain-containing protein [Kiloniella majae]|uniref:IclR family transcriptional regulator domain-containing protein n=1 Tax=Kiloniella majae TaxID=1938558 RepID=UPI000A27830D|nr:helix-turn-helix domain-containing protein [Kiloniella majae]
MDRDDYKPNESKPAPYKPVRALSRGLALLQILNREGPLSVQGLSNSSGLNRTTVYRLLETLERDGFVQSGALSSSLWHLKIGVKSLSEGYDHRDWVTQLGAPVLGKLLKKVIWPTDLAAFDGRGMLIRETTHKFSPLSNHRSMVGVRWPVLSSSLGRAFFCYSDEKTRASILRVLKASNDPADRVAKDQTHVANLVRVTRERGYAQSVDETAQGISSIARPVFYRGQVVASINMVFFSSALSPKVAADKHLSDINQAVAELEENLLDSSDVFKQQLEDQAY